VLEIAKYGDGMGRNAEMCKKYEKLKRKLWGT
jgi:hypothetical protein